MYPRKEEKDILKQWFGITRRAYNKSVEIHKKVEENDNDTIEAIQELANEPKIDKDGTQKTKEDKDGNVIYLTRGWNDALKLYVRRMERENAEDYVLKVPQAIRDSGICDHFKAIESGKARNEERIEAGDEEKKEQFKFRTRRDKTQTMEINAREFNRKNGKIGKLLELVRTKKEAMPDKADCAVRVQMDRLGRVFLCFVKEVEAKSENQAPSVNGSYHSTCALDPGVRTFQTIYDADGMGIEWGKKDHDIIFRMCRQADGIVSKMGKGRATNSLRKAYNRKIKRIKDKVKECHNKLALFLCENYRVVLIPEFNTSSMVQKNDRKIRSKTVRQMCTWSHYSFRQTLLAKAELHPWCKIIICDEAYTSKTCGCCGHIRQSFSGKTFKCPKCNHKADRDLHGARNILLRYLTREDIKYPERWI